jgi:UDP-N-acetylglucosamine diphosphorylase / glucose-1-phosphate thymidylyltransferase / UDP-N-acetylgalactosamine diphosphorylase / glucosamine-1-phosphate N-acetyltransferase / galactosamine-1-phosphate N-acetyltransferase
MNKIVFTEEFCSPEQLFPFTLTRQIQDIRVGILTIREKWEQLLDMASFDRQENDYKDLDRSMVINENIGKDHIYLIHGNLLPTPRIIKLIRKLKPGEMLSQPGKENFAYCISKKQVIDAFKIRVDATIELKDEELKEIRYPWDICRLNGWSIEQDFQLLKASRKKATISATNKVIGEKNIFIEKGAEVEHCFLNATEGPIYIARGAKLMEGCMLRGPVAVGERSVLKMGTKIYGATTIGPDCVVGGEIKNSVFFGCSNKAHDGYIGDSVIGEWCNMGAGTSNSNVKNTATDVFIYTPNGPMNAGLKCGMMMGDYSRTAINTSINTGTVIGVSAHVFGNGLTPKFIPSFSWGADGIQSYRFENAIRDINNWMQLKGRTLSGSETSILRHIFDHY